MKESGHYSEEDFQSYLDNNFAGDTASLEAHVEGCELCRNHFGAYLSVWSFAKNDLQTKPLRIDLAYTVANKVFTVKESKPVFEKVMYGMSICLGIACLPLCFNYLISRSIPTPFILLIIPVGLYLLLTYKEIRIVKEKFVAVLTKE